MRSSIALTQLLLKGTLANMASEAIVDLIKVPTEAGTHFPGQSKAPDAVIEAAWLRQKLQDIGFDTRVHEPLRTSAAAIRAATWHPAPKVNGVRNESDALQVMQTVRRYLVLGGDGLQDTFPVFIGGDCSITPAILAGLWQCYPEHTQVGLLYIDGDVDLTLPSQTSVEGSSGILDSMTLTHLTGRVGGLDSMRGFTRPNGKPLIDPDNIVLFGFDPLQSSSEAWTYLLEHQFKAYSRPTVQKGSVQCMKAALGWLRQRVDVILVHFDLDVVDSGEIPLANYPHYAGLTADQAFAALEEALECEQVRGLIVTEINPSNDPDGQMVERVVDAIVRGMSRRLQ